MRTTIRELIDRNIISLDTVVLGEPMLTRDGAWIGSGGEFYVWKRWTDGNARRAVAIDGKNRKYLVRVSNKDQSWSSDRAFASADVARLEGNTHDMRRDIRER